MGDVATKVRRGIARINYMSQDRPDLSPVAKVMSQHMSKPREGAVHTLQRCVCYLKKFLVMAALVPRRVLKTSVIWWPGLTVTGLEMQMLGDRPVAGSSPTGAQS